MEIVAEGKNFRLVSEEELPAVADFIEQYLPESLKQTIKTYLINKVWDFYFYVSKNWPEEPICIHFPGCTTTPNDHIYRSINIFCPSDQPELVDLVINEDILIDATSVLIINFAHQVIVERLQKAFYAKDIVEGDVYVCENIPEDLDDDELPKSVELVRLRGEHMRDVYDLYPANDMECVEVFERLVKELPAYAIFSEGRLAAWMVQSYYGAMFSMQTRPEFRRKGFGSFLARRLAREVAERGYTPFVIIRPDNDASKALYTKLGFTKRYRVVRTALHPKQ